MDEPQIKSCGEWELQIESIETVRLQMQKVESNYKHLETEWINLKYQVLKEEKLHKNYVLVHKDDLAAVAMETMQLSQNLNKVLNKHTIQAVAQFPTLQKEVEELRKCKQQLESELVLAASRYERAFQESQADKEENVSLRCEVQDLEEQLTQQSEYCTSLGVACGSLLWRVSCHEDSVQAILSGTKVEEFLELVTSTLDSYLVAYCRDWPQDSSLEASFIFALCGVITNIAASALGREYLIKKDQGKQLLSRFLNFLTLAPISKSAKLKNLILMALYNVSINQTGLKFLCSEKDIIGLLTWHLQTEADAENMLSTMRLLQSLLSDGNQPSLLHELHEALPKSVLQTFSRHHNKDIQTLALELLMELWPGSHHRP